MNTRYGSRYPPFVFQILLLYFLALFLELLSSPWRFFVWRSLYSRHWLVMVKSYMKQSYCSFKISMNDTTASYKILPSLNSCARMPRCVTLFHQTRWRSKRGFWRPTASVDHISSISSSSSAWAAFNFIKFFIFLNVEVVGRRRTWPLEEIAAKFVTVSLKWTTITFFAFVILFLFFVFQQKKCFSNWGASTFEMLFKWSSVLYFAKCHDCRRWTAVLVGTFLCVFGSHIFFEGL